MFRLGEETQPRIIQVDWALHLPVSMSLSLIVETTNLSKLTRRHILTPSPCPLPPTNLITMSTVLPTRDMAPYPFMLFTLFPTPSSTANILASISFTKIKLAISDKKENLANRKIAIEFIDYTFSDPQA